MARYLGPNNFGILTFGLSLIGILGVFTDLGLNTLMTREIARDRSKNLEYFSNFITIKLVLIFLIFIFIIPIINLFNYAEETIYVILILILSLVFNTFSDAFYSLFRAYEKLEYQSIIIIISSALSLVCVLLAVYFQLNIIVFAGIYLFVGLFSLIYTIFIAKRNFILPKIKIHLDFWRNNIKIALGFGMIGIFATVYVWIDSSMLFFMQGNEATGIYGAAYKIVLALLFIPSAINAAVFPVMSRFYTTSKYYLEKITERYFKYMLMLGIPMGVVLTVLAPKLIIMIYGNGYSDSVLSFQILIWGTVFTFANAAFVQFFQSTNRELVVTKITGLWMIGNILLNLILIPKYSYIGASINTLITEFGVALFLILVYNNINHRISEKRFFIMISKIVMVSLIIGIIIQILNFLHLFVLIIIATLLFALFSYIVGIIDNEDVKLIKRVLHLNN